MEFLLFFSIFSVNYGGVLNAWNFKGEKLETRKLEDNPLKCLDVFSLGTGRPFLWNFSIFRLIRRIVLESHVLVGSQNQIITLFKVQSGKKTLKFEALSVFRGHERSVECCTANSDGTRFVSGGFDNCLKVWNLDEGLRLFLNFKC